jgi:hypothetical protein
MSDKTICPNCGYDGSPGADYCARCGRKLKPSSVEMAGKFDRFIDNLNTMHFGILGLLLLIPVGILSEYLIVSKLSFNFSVLLVALMIGGGYAYLGWELVTKSSTRQLLLRLLLMVGGIMVSLLAILIIDQMLLNFSIDSTETVTFRMPGVYAESSISARRAVIDNAPPYSLFVIVYGMISSGIGNTFHRARNSFQTAGEQT